MYKRILTHFRQFFGIMMMVTGAIAVIHFVNIFDDGSSDLVLPKHLKSDLIPGESIDHLIWFIQISDLHISKFHDQGRITDFQDFCNITVDVIKPSVVLASGDLTDAMNLDGVSSTQFEEEWETYKSILHLNNITNKTVWLDVRGNHDSYDVPSILNRKNYFQNFSIQGPHHTHSYMYSMKKGEDSVAFISVDASQLPAPKRPFNFIGILPSKEFELLESFEKEGRKHNYTIWFGHYPTSSIISSKPGFTSLMEHSYAYLCGHFHTVYGYAPYLYTMQRTGWLELEVADWKENRFFRVAALDNGLFSFVDIKHGTWPIILITNPKDAQFLIKGKEPISSIGNSSHIRVLVWSSTEIKRVVYKINSLGEWLPMAHKDGPLYTAPWIPQRLVDGIHKIEVEAEDANGNRNIVHQSFSVNGEKIPFAFKGRFILMSNLTLMFQLMFGCMVSLCVIPLCFVRIIHYNIIAKGRKPPKFNRLLRKIWILASINKLFYPLILTSLYIAIGPWFIGEILTGHIGVTFVWGTFVCNSYIPGSLTYFHGMLQMMTFHLPLMILASIAVDMRYQLWHMRRKSNLIYTALLHVLFACLNIKQAKNSYTFFMEYGTMAFLLGPLRTWTVLFGVYIWYTSSTLRKKDIRSLEPVRDILFTSDVAM